MAIEGIEMGQEADQSTCLLASHHLRKQLKRLRKRCRELAGGSVDPEHVHKARVASRRLRSVLRSFGDCIPTNRDKLKQITKEFRKTLGEARDLDVHVDYLRQLRGQARDNTARKGLKLLIEQTHDERRKADGDVISAAGDLLKSDVITRARKSARQTRRRLRRQGVTPGSRTSLLRAAGTLEYRWQKLVEKSEAIGDPSDSQGLHAMRIAVKRLRYALELYVKAMPGRPQYPLEKLKDLQTFLGDVHDCDVWQKQIRDFASLGPEMEHESDTRQQAISSALKLIQENRREFRANQYDRARAVWASLVEGNVVLEQVRNLRQSARS
jgi:CHAD domain-containing protein